MSDEPKPSSFGQSSKNQKSLILLTESVFWFDFQVARRQLPMFPGKVTTSRSTTSSWSEWVGFKTCLVSSWGASVAFMILDTLLRKRCNCLASIRNKFCVWSFVAHFVSVLYLPKLKGAWQFDNIANFFALVKYFILLEYHLSKKINWSIIKAKK